MTTKPRFQIGDIGYLFDPQNFLADPLNRPASRYRALRVTGKVRRLLLLEVEPGLIKRVPMHKVLTAREFERASKVQNIVELEQIGDV
jgi:hypothetical protein